MKKVYVGVTNLDSSIDGPGISHVIYFAGCRKNCKGCFNPELKTQDNAKYEDIEVLKQQISENILANCLVFQGGEPFIQYDAMRDIACYAKSLPNPKTIIVYTGYTLEELANDAFTAYGCTGLMDLLSPFDYIIAGPFEIDKLKDYYWFTASENKKIYKIETADGKTKLTEIQEHDLLE
jgi:anaerobic ribonucleoside-triphosphate reductase activating protein